MDVSLLYEYWPDAAYDGTAHTWCIVYEDWFSATDRDAYFALLNDAGTGASGFYLDLSSDSFDSLHVANNAGSNQFMIVSSVTSGNQVYVLASTIHTNGQPGTQTVVTGTEYGTIRNCVIGGDPYTGGAGPSYYCIVYERQYSSTDWDIVCRLINAAGTLVGSGPIYFSNSSNTIDVGPAISKSDGTHDWMIVWQRNNGYVNDADVWGGILHWDGTTFAPPFQISAWFQPEWQVAVSSPLNGPMRFLATWQDTDGGDDDIIMALLDGATKLDQQDLSIDDQFNYTLDQIESSVDSDGDQFLVAYSELYSWPDYDTYASDVYVSANNTLALAQRHVNLDYDSTKDHSSRVVGCYMNGNVTNPALHHRFLVAWNSSPNPSGPADVKGAFFDNFDAGQATSFCFGDGTGAACPCGNTGFTGHGCENSSGTGGGLLIASGIASLANDTLLFTTQNEKPNALSTVSQGDAQIAPIPFGQGLRCAGGHLKRLYSKTSFNGSITAPEFGDPSVHARSAQLGDTIVAGSVRYYYVYYRDAIVLGGCSPGATFNNTQSVAVTWAP
jgi:hypothetical protein